MSKPQMVAAVIGDLVSSRAAPNRGKLHAALSDVLKNVNRDVPPVQPLDHTVGDEFQGVYANLAAAIEATLRLRLRLNEVSDVRFGIGWGTLEVFDEGRSPFAQDGPAWWAARDALDEISGSQRRQEAPRGLRTAVRGEELAEEVGVMNAFLICRDEILSNFDPRDAEILVGLLEGKTQTELAKRFGMSQSGVAQRIARNGTNALMRSHEQLKGRA